MGFLTSQWLFYRSILQIDIVRGAALGKGAGKNLQVLNGESVMQVLLKAQVGAGIRQGQISCYLYFLSASIQ